MCKNEERRLMLFQFVSIIKNKKHIIENRLSREKLDIYPAQHKLLMQLPYDSSISQKELAMKLQVSQATVAVSIKKLVKDGYVMKANQEDDNRFNVITITEKGKNIIEKSINIFDGVDEKMLKGFSEEEIDTLDNMLKRILVNLEECE